MSAKGVMSRAGALSQRGTGIIRTCRYRQVRMRVMAFLGGFLAEKDGLMVQGSRDGPDAFERFLR